MSIAPDELLAGLARAMARAGLSAPSNLERLTGGATMESWRFEATGAAPLSIPSARIENTYVLRRAPSLEFMKDRPFGHDVEAAIIRAAKAAGVAAPVVVAELEPEDGIGSGFIMEALCGTPNPKEILATDKADRLVSECAANLASIHTLTPGDVPDAVPVMDYRAAIADLKQQFEDAGGDRPIIALGLKWMENNCPEPVDPVLLHGDYRMGNLLVQDGWLTGVLDWELAHFGDYHEDLAFGCMAVWRFHRYDRPALGLSDLEHYFEAYEANGGRKVNPARFRYWLIHRTVWWALGCLKMAAVWRSGEDRMLERVVISRRTSEQELDLLMLLEEEAPEQEQSRLVQLPSAAAQVGEATDGELAIAIHEWLGTVKDRFEGHDRFQYAVARNALGMISRYDAAAIPAFENAPLARQIFSGEATLADTGLLAQLREAILATIMQDVPKYPALAVARKKWTGED
ncbi:phosphotransferase [Erythrobacter crassostreae]|uniref:Phosphotransferase family protein n=1 Tax=Erythrobacter crassostreae TaxID=2828328 RepID=A0A9X1JM10_9SPHN|nr:phosphotransferase [Erythrobacter crassostrea]MBV7258894.1 phosphotransferase family protein [Erythrobacter crassostrea]